MNSVQINQTSNVVVSIPQEFASVFSGIHTDLQSEIKQYLAVKFYLQSRLTIGKAAEFAGLTRNRFELYLADNKLPISCLNFADIESDLKNLDAVD
ncbi:MAG: UPF0175 family protein [Endomicrobium sp.]|jgi:predicted HTH domain antitoxin|nr:UPF0175 family protein [Endomicrobium sp.]